MASQKIVAVGFLTDLDLQRLGSGFARAYPVSDAEDFADLLKQLEAVEWLPHRDRDDEKE
ncbi:hypothetical protein [Sphingomonas sp. G-3-2-10]|jgi:hypothetical protein|uniref:hypothetical protein n=1 Tax=Sphingomonas sp. G-3-2-10 TaxID=2728838 RepID=UPI00146D3F7E|nr:hypothetical protein [Sphingomonas sp. G-3-2-10]NML07986.1 hypothetical protein [Sphingomonas sp. G-3-2-10]